MAYCNIDDIKNILPESDLIDLTDDAQAGEVNEAIVNAAIADADSFINTYLRSKYSLPLVEVPSVVKNLSIQITIYGLFSRHMLTDMPESLETRYKLNLQTLSNIQNGKQHLGISTVDQDTPAATTNNVITNKTSDDRVFNDDLLQGY